LIWCHSGYSFHQGTATLEQLVESAGNLGWKSLALTDLNGIYGSVWFWRMTKEAGLQPILGAELKEDRGESAILLVKSAEGYKRLCRILSQRHLKENFCLRRALREDSAGLCVLTSQEPLALFLSKIPDLDFYFIITPNQIQRSLRFARNHHLQPVAGAPVFYLKPEDRVLHHLLRAIDLNQSLSGVRQEELVSEPGWMPSPAEFQKWYQAFPEALRHLEALVEKCVLPRPPWGETVLFDFEGRTRDQCFHLLAQKAREGARKRYCGLGPEVNARIDKELGLIRDKGLASYFLIIEDIVKRFPITCGRGSAAASVISYCLFITQVDPIRHNLFFERFLSPGRKDPPDIDLDFPWDERDQALEYVFQRYGPERAAMVSNHLSFQGRAALRETARVFGIPEPEISRVTGRMRGFLDLLQPIKEMKKDPLFRGLNFDPPWDRIIELALRLEGLPCGMSVHCGGVVIAERIQDRVPVQTAAKGVNIIQWEKDQTEDAGLVKLDLLGNRSLAVIRDGLSGLNEKQGLKLKYDELEPLDDAETQELIAGGKTMGVFYIESPATRQLQQKTRVGDFEHLVIHSSIIRPAAHKWINEYVKRLRGERWEPIDPRLNQVLSGSYGIMVYQEDVMKVASELADFSIEDADELRRTLSKKHREKKLREFKRKFQAGAGKNGLGLEQSEKIWEMIGSFQGYSFCKPHSASYAMVSFKSAWLKAHYPAEFISAVISNQGGYYSAFAYLSEARRMGLSVKMPEINQSRFEYTAEGEAIRVGLMQIKGLKKNFAGRMLREREENGRYQGLLEFMDRVEPEPESARLLVKAGCFDQLEGAEARIKLLWMINNRARLRPKGQAGLFPAGGKIPGSVRKPTEDELLRQEEETLGFLISRHPLALFQDQIQKLPVTSAAEFRNKIGRRIIAAGVCVTGKLAETSRGELMQFVSFEDERDIYETVFFPKAYRRYCPLLRINSACLLFGTVTSDLNAISLQVENIKPLGKRPGLKSLPQESHPRLPCPKSLDPLGPAFGNGG